MLQIFEIARLIEKELNANLNAVATKTVFKVHNAVGNYEKAIAKGDDGKLQKKTNGVLRATTGNWTPVKSLNNLMTTLVLEFAVEQDKCDSTMLVLDSWSEQVIGAVYGLAKDVQMLITPSPATPGQAKNTAPLGAMIPLTVVLDIQLIKGGLISNAVGWTCNGLDLAPSNVSVSFNRTPDTVAKANQNVARTNNQYEVRSVVMVLPLVFTDIDKKLMDDMFLGNKDEVYLLERKDGFFPDYSDNFIITNGDYAEESGKIATLTLTFAPADLDDIEDIVPGGAG